MIVIWQAPNIFNLSAENIFIWRIHVPDFVSCATQDFNLLDENEKARAKAFKFHRDRESFIVSHVALRRLLGLYLKISPEKIQFEYDQYKKPHLIHHHKSELHFNLSHSHDYALVAMTLKNDIGIDIEYMRDTRDVEQIAQRFFSEAEFEEYQHLPNAQKLEGFYNAWTRKEAFIKAIGKGLYYPLKDFVVSLAPGKDAVLKTLKEGSAESWCLIGFKPADNYCAAVAVPCKNKIVEFYDYTARQ